MSTTERWEQIDAILESARQRPAGERASFVKEAGGDDETLIRDISLLLDFEAQKDGFLDRPIARITVDETPPRLTIGDWVGPYRLAEIIGRGGMGTVFRGVRSDTELHREVAIKVIRRDLASDELTRRFRSERQILAALDHPNIARLLDAGTTEQGHAFVIMERIDGIPIDRYCDDHLLSIEERIALFRRVCSAVGHAHRNLVVHRDLKPNNVLVTAAGTPKLLDFGIAKILENAAFPHTLAPTRTGVTPMTPAYASPEQLTSAPITTSTDVYGLGLLLYRLLTGRLPWPPGPGLVPLQARSNTVPVRPSLVWQRAKNTSSERAAGETPSDQATPPLPAAALRKRLAGDLDAIVLKALRAEPEQRFGSADDLAADLGRHLSGLPVSARQGTLGYLAGRFLRRHRFAALVTAIALIVIFGFGVALAKQRDQARRDRDSKASVLALMLDIFRVADPRLGGDHELSVIDALDQNRPLIKQQLRNEPLLLAEVLRAIATLYANLSRFEEARQSLVHVLAIHREILGDRHVETAISRNQLGDVMTELAEYGHAEALIRGSISTLRAHFGSTDQALIEPMNSLASLFCAQDDPVRGDLPSIEALALARQHPDQVDALRVALINRARMFSLRGYFSLAITFYREALDIAVPVLGADHPDLAELFLRLGSMYRQEGDLDQAESVLESALAILRDHYDEEHLGVINALNNLGLVYLERQDYDRAETFSREALNRFTRRGMLDHPLILLLTNRVATARLAGGHSLPETEATLRALLERFGGRPHEPRHLAITEGLLGACLLRRGAHAEAEERIIHSFEELSTVGSDNDLRQAFERLKALFSATGKPERIEPYHARLAERAPPKG